MGRTLRLSLLLLYATPAVCQSTADTAFIARAKEHLISIHSQALGAQSRLYNGSKYAAPQHTLEEHPFFESDDWLTGAAFYDGEYFGDIPLMYDCYNEALITEHGPSGHPIQLVRTKLKYFSIAGHSFERIENESVSNSLPRTGFYDVLHPGNTKLIARRQKLLREEIEASLIERYFDVRNRYYLYRNGVYLPVKNKSTIIRILSDRKTELKRFIKQNHLRFSVDRELLLKSTAEYYDTLQ